MTEKKLIPYLFLVFSLFFASYSFAAEVHFQWGASSGIVEGYRIYYGSSHEGPYPNLLDQVGGTTTEYLASLNEGQEYYLVVRAFNDYGESGDSNEVKWTSGSVDSEPPNTFGHVPAKNATDVSPDTNIVVRVQDSGDGVDQSFLVMKVNGETVQPLISGSSADYTLTYDPAIDFPYSATISVSIDAKDLAGNVMPTDGYSFTTISEPDTTPPTIQITSPTTDPSCDTTSSTINLAGSANDNVQVSHVTWSNTRDGSGTASGTTIWTIGGITLAEGENVITVTAEDSSGNTQSDSITVNYTIPQGTYAEVHFQWGASSGVVDGYRIYYGFTHQGPYPNLLVEVGGTTTEYTATLEEGLTYYLVVRAFNDYGESGNSNEVVWPSDDPDLTPPREITNAHMIGFDGSNLELGWTNPTTYDEYGELIPENQDFEGVMIRYNIGSDAPYPANHTEGTLFVDFKPAYLDENNSYTEIMPAEIYKFSFFTHDADGHYSTAVHLLVDAKLPPVNVPPTIDSFTGTPASLNNPGETITLNALATDPDGDSLTYTINFGDGTASESGSEVVHAYASAGTYTADVTVDDGHGNTVGESLQIAVNDVPPAKPTNVTVK